MKKIFKMDIVLIFSILSFCLSTNMIQSCENDIHSSSNLKEIVVSQIEKIECDSSDPHKETYYAYLGKRKKLDDYLYVFRNKTSEKICCFRKCTDPFDWIVLNESYFHLLKKVYEQNQNI
jgi:hypothetical protein